MKKRPVAVIRESRNVYCDFKKSNVDIEQLKATMAAEIIKALDREGLKVREAQARTGIGFAGQRGSRSTAWRPMDLNNRGLSH